MTYLFLAFTRKTQLPSLQKNNQIVCAVRAESKHGPGEPSVVSGPGRPFGNSIFQGDILKYLQVS